MSEIQIDRAQPLIVKRDQVQAVTSGDKERQHKSGQQHRHSSKQKQLSKRKSKRQEECEHAVPSKTHVKAAVAQLNQYVQKVKRDLVFGLEEETGNAVVTVKDRASEQIVRVLKSEAAIDLAKKLETQDPLYLFSAQV